MKKNTVRYGRFVATFFALGFIIYGAVAIVSDAKARVPPADVTIIPLPTSAQNSNPDEPLAINDKIHEVECGSGGKVLNAIIDVEITGGVPPYYVEFDPGNQVIPNLQESIVRLTLQGGKSSTVRVRSATSDGQPMDAKDIHAPSYDPACEAPTVTATSTTTTTPTASTPTKHIYFTATATKNKENDQSPDSLSTTLVFNSTSTPVTKPVSTVTSAPPSTPTVNNPTSTLATVSVSTVTSVPPPTPTTHPSFAECEDGQDNDGDGQIDLQDSQCQRNSDNHEDH